MKKILTILSVVLTACATGNPGEGDTGRIQIDLAERGHAVPESMYGIFFEEINHAGDGGLYAELIQNRGFEDSTVPEGYRLEGGELRPPALPNHLTGALPSPDMKLRWNTAEIPAWTLQQTAGSGASMYLNREYPLDPATPTALCVALPTQSRTTVTNSGYWGIHIEKGKNYRLVLYTSNIGRFKGDVTVRLISENGSELCSHRIDAGTGKAWKRHDATLTPTDSDSRARFVIELDGQGTLLLDYVSLFPQETFRNRENGLRRDVAETLEALHPAFIRWPGGGIVEGITDKNYITNSYHIHVTEHINAFDKLAFESQFQALSPGGAISYVEVPNMQNNIDAVLEVMKFIYDHIMYAELNTKSDYCQVCGFDGEIEIKEDPDGKLVWTCPQCGNTDQSKMNVARRTCGYIGTQYWNQGRTQEIRDRVLHL